MIVPLIAAAAFLTLTGPALACGGTTEYPETAETLRQSTLTAERKAELEKALTEGRALHDKAHETDDGAMMGQSMQMLRELQARMK